MIQEQRSRLNNPTGVPVTLWRAVELIHGFLPLGRAIAASSRALDRLGAALKAGLAA